MPLPRGSKKSDKTRKYQNQFDKENYKVAATKIQISVYDRFQVYAKQRGKTVSGLLSDFINDCLCADPGQPENRQTEKENGSD